MSIANVGTDVAPLAHDIYVTCFEPLGHHVLVYPDQVNDRIGSIFLTQQTRQQEQLARIFGTVVKVGPQAWKAHDPTGRGEGEPWAKPGDRIVFAKYGGFVLEDPDTKECYRLLNDEDVTCKVNEENRKEA